LAIADSGSWDVRAIARSLTFGRIVMRSLTRSRAATFALWSGVAFASASMAFGQSITDFGPLPGGGPIFPRSVNADGSVVVGFAHNGVTKVAVRWSSANGLQDLGVLPGTAESAAHGVSGDGAAVVGDEETDLHGGGAFTWTEAGGMQGFDLPGWDLVYLTGISASGEQVIGSCRNPAGGGGFLWSPAGGLQLLDPSDQFGEEVPVAMSHDGSVIVGGYYFGRGFRWSGAGVMQDIGTLPGQIHATAVDVNDDGTIAVGSSGTFIGSTGWSYLHACRWDASGEIEDLGLLPGDTHSYATGVSGAGSIVIGASYHDAGTIRHSRPFLWTPSLGMVDLTAHLTAQGVDLTAWDLSLGVVAISDDGATLVGNGVHNGQGTGWIVRGLLGASWTNYGHGYSGTNGIPSIVPQSDPEIGTTVTIDVGNSRGLPTFGVLLIGDESANLPTRRGGRLLVRATSSLPVVLGPSGGRIDLVIPDDESLCGTHLYTQALEFDPGAVSGYAFTPGLELRLGH
jgi:uncharacterized membrane protein